MWYLRLVETNRVPDRLIRLGIRAIVAAGLRQRYRVDPAQQEAERRALLETFRRSPIAIHVDDANRQHYEVPAAFFKLVLGKWLKYSCCYWPDGVATLDGAEEAMLRLTCERARVEDGMDILDLGCGWGSLAVWIATHYPESRVLAVSNSRTQQEFIDAQCRARGLKNVEAVTADVSTFETDRRFDRVVSVEMFEHMKNYERLMAKIAGFLRPRGMLFVHIFSHRALAYEFDADDAGDWMAQTYFSGGTMPSDDLLLHFQRDLHLLDRWRIDGRHYARTLRAWLEKLDRHEAQVREVLAGTYGPDKETLWLVNWRLFFMACEETFRYRRGIEYGVSHYLFEKRAP
jgi:cyclopropane-fatty-acyl-phospholipid synthase